MLCSLSVVFAEETEEVEDTSKFEQVLLKKGSLIVKEFVFCCYFEEDDYIKKSSPAWTNAMEFQTASLLDMETGEKVYALRVRTGYYNSDYDKGEAIGVMDADEIDGAIQTLRYIKANIDSLKDYSEITYTASSGMEVGAYYSSKGKSLYVQVNSRATKFYDVSKIDSLIAAFEKVKATLEK